MKQIRSEHAEMRNFYKLTFQTAFCSIFLAPPAISAEFSGIPVNDSMLPSEIVKAIPIDITTDQFKARLKQGGTLILDGNTLVLGSADASKKSAAFMALDKLELKHGAKIITNGNVLTIFVNTLSSEDGSIISYDDTGSKAAPGLPPARTPGTSGNPGDAGLSGGVVALHVVQTVNGLVHVDLRGQSGGDGTDGVKGGTPPQAGRGVDAKDGPLGILGLGWCERGGGDGQPGFQGLQGGAAGAGGRGGDGGHFELVNIGSAPIPSSSYTFSAKHGDKGKVGKPGVGGDGGRGGDGGHGATYCHGGNSGLNGPQGIEGPVPTTIQESADGTSIVKNIDIEVMVRTSVISSSTASTRP